MLFLLFGSSAAGKTFALDALRRRARERLAIHDFDEIGVPPNPDSGWRHRGNEEWIGRALEYQSQGVDLLLAGQTPLGELLASPSAPRLEAISACLVDCADDVRLARLRARGPQWLERSPGELHDYVSWGAWMRAHATDPQFMTHVIRHEASEALRWDRWNEWQRGDPRWRVHVVDSSRTSAEQVADELGAWIEDERRLFRDGKHPLAAWARTCVL